MRKSLSLPTATSQQSLATLAGLCMGSFIEKTKLCLFRWILFRLEFGSPAKRKSSSDLGRWSTCLTGWRSVLRIKGMVVSSFWVGTPWIIGMTPRRCWKHFGIAIATSTRMFRPTDQLPSPSTCMEMRVGGLQNGHYLSSVISLSWDGLEEAVFHQPSTPTKFRECFLINLLIHAFQSCGGKR